MNNLPLKEHYSKLAALLTEKSAEYDFEYLEASGSADDDMYIPAAYIDQSGRLLDICGPDYFQGSSSPYAVIPLPWRGNGTELEVLVEEQIENMTHEW